MSEMMERVARALAKRAGDNWDDMPNHKGHWIKERGMFNGRFRDVNERFRCDYLDEAQAAIEAMREPTEAMINSPMARCYNDGPFADKEVRRIYSAMIDAALPPAHHQVTKDTEASQSK